MTRQTAVRTLAAARWLDAHPDLPEPLIVSGFPDFKPVISWHVTEDVARGITAAVGDGWAVHTYPEKPRTIAAREVEVDCVTIDLTVVVEGVNIPDLAGEAVPA